MVVPQSFRLIEGISLSGVGLHGGQASHVRIEPGRPGRGIFLNDEPVCPGRIMDTRWATTLRTQSGPVSTTEHLFAALAGAGLWDVEITVMGAEIPILDGSAARWYQVLEERRVPTSAPHRPLVLTAPIRVECGASWISAVPYDGFRMAVTIQYPKLDERTIVGGIDAFQMFMSARTFGFRADHGQLLRLGLAQAASLENTLVLDEASMPLNPGPMFWRDEMVAHKWLDLLGDLAQLGRPLHADISAYRPGHELNHRLCLALDTVLAT
ncbi:MAG: UDP-3-O-acyl-N-acetylglucosamine deacetylase [Myxococcota bacterium]|nr:UDP-3-O-acyl-N-acetylglucosamine deacetylase [Myxococcota bacterium]